MRLMKKPWILLIPLVFLDIITKLLAKEKTIDLFPFLAFAYMKNTGVLFGLFKNNNLLWIILTALIIGILINLYHKEKQYRTGLVLLLAGAFGNLIDRIAHGFVIDFINFKIWPIFNLADVYIVSGIILILLHIRTKNL